MTEHSGLSKQISMSNPMPDLEEYVREVLRVSSIDEIDATLDSFDGLRVMVISDLIIDEYAYCRVAGTVTKWPVLSAVFQDISQMLGGGAAIARHLRAMGAEVTFVSTVGDKEPNHVGLLETLEREGITTKLFTWPDSYTVTKRRYITGGYPNPLEHSVSGSGLNPDTRLFEISFLPDAPMPSELEQEICDYVSGRSAEFELMLTADFGHGLMTDRIRHVVPGGSDRFAANAQTNSTNFGFNRINKYEGANLVCLDELEARLPSGDRASAIESIAADLRDRLGCESLIVTRGSNGLLISREGSVQYAPALAPNVVDPLGAGDALFSAVALSDSRGTDPVITGFVGSCSGAIAAGIIGNETPVTRSDIKSFARQLLSGSRPNPTR